MIGCSSKTIKEIQISFTIHILPKVSLYCYVWFYSFIVKKKKIVHSLRVYFLCIKIWPKAQVIFNMVYSQGELIKSSNGWRCSPIISTSNQSNLLTLMGLKSLPWMVSSVHFMKHLANPLFMNYTLVNFFAWDIQ